MLRGEVTTILFIYLFPFTLLEITQRENTYWLSKRKKKVSQSVICSPGVTSTFVYFIISPYLVGAVRGSGSVCKGIFIFKHRED